MGSVIGSGNAEAANPAGGVLEDDLGLGARERCPGGAGGLVRRVTTGLVEDLDLVPESEGLGPVNPAGGAFSHPSTSSPILSSLSSPASLAGTCSQVRQTGTYLRYDRAVGPR